MRFMHSRPSSSGWPRSLDQCLDSLNQYLGSSGTIDTGLFETICDKKEGQTQ